MMPGHRRTSSIDNPPVWHRRSSEQRRRLSLPGDSTPYQETCVSELITQVLPSSTENLLYQQRVGRALDETIWMEVVESEGDVSDMVLQVTLFLTTSITTLALTLITAIYTITVFGRVEAMHKTDTLWLSILTLFTCDSGAGAGSSLVPGWCKCIIDQLSTAEAPLNVATVNFLLFFTIYLKRFEVTACDVPLPLFSRADTRRLLLTLGFLCVEAAAVAVALFWQDGSVTTTTTIARTCPNLSHITILYLSLVVTGILWNPRDMLHVLKEKKKMMKVRLAHEAVDFICQVVVEDLVQDVINDTIFTLMSNTDRHWPYPEQSSADDDDNVW